jgi:hypothetical protein
MLAVACCGLLLIAPRAGADAGPSVEGAGAVADLNAQRSANGISPVTLNQSLVWWCPDEDDPTFLPGEWTRELSGYTDWGVESSPWDAAELHQFGMYNPAFSEAGDANVAGAACMGLGGIVPTAPEPVFHAFTGDLGPTAVPPLTYTEGEYPFQTQEIVGIPEGQVTGPQLLVYVTGSWPGQPPGLELQAESWSLTDEAGEAVPNVRMADEETSLAYSGLHGYLFDGGVIVPPVLAPNRHFVATVHWRYGTSEATQVVPFTTNEGSPEVIFSQTAHHIPFDPNPDEMVEVTSHARGYPMTECYFEYGPTSSYGARAPCEGGRTGTGNGVETAILGNLTPGLLYHFCLRAKSAGHLVQSWDETFVAPASSQPPSSLGSQSPSESAVRGLLGTTPVSRLTSELLRRWKALSITTLLHTGHDRAAIVAAGPASISVVWEIQRQAGKHRREVWDIVARGSLTPSRAGSTHIAVSLTPEGCSLLAQVRRVTIRARIRLVSTVGVAAETTSFTLAR